MELQLVSFEQATALKELGFPQETDSWNYYDIEGKCVPYLQKGNHKKHCCDAPTLEVVTKWLREEKNIHIEPLFQDFTVYVCHFCKGIDSKNYLCDNEGYEITFDSYEEALSAGIDKAIEILKQQ